MVRLFHFGAISLLAAVEVQVADGLFDRHDPLRIERFSSAGAFQDYLERIRARRRQSMQEQSNDLATFDVEEAPPPEEEPPPPPIEAPAVAQQVSALPQAMTNPAITNNQTIGVDEGGIVKQVGRFLVVLQDGRLFSADLGAVEGAPLRLADRITVYRNRENAADWYDEMLVHEDRILVTAFNYRDGASEISVFRIGAEGQLRREGRFLLDSNDYYSTENYSTRLVGDSLVFYAPVALIPYDQPDRPFEFPRIRRARGDAEADAGTALIGATQIYAPPGEIDEPVLHTVSVCPLRDEDLDCRTTAFVGGSSREIYVTPTDAFLWLGAPDALPWAIEYANRRRAAACRTEQMELLADDQRALVYRVPLDGSAIGAIAVDGYPVDQFALDSRDGRFRALLRRPRGECLDSIGRQPLALVDIPLAAFGASVRNLADAAYRPLPQIEGHQLENRFLGDWLLYGGRRGWTADPAQPESRPGASTLFAVALGRGGDPLRVRLPHNVLRIERAGSDAILTGYAGPAGLSLSYLTLGTAPRLAATTTLAGRVESENRSHAFGALVRPDGTGLVGLPTTRRTARAGRGWSDSESSDLSYVRIGADRSLAHAGELSPGRRRGPTAYRCEVSCVDWYGNSRPIFTGGRIFALMGTDLVEGRLQSGRIAEAGRVDLTGAVSAR